MKPFTKHTGSVVAMDRANVDTDQIIPKQFLKRIERIWLWRVPVLGLVARPKRQRSSPISSSTVPKPKGASVLLARINFGCGSSREHAPWALEDWGFRVIVAPSFADIFYNNCFKNGMLPIVLSEAQVDDLFKRAAATPGYSLTADLENQTLSDNQGLTLNSKSSLSAATACSMALMTSGLRSSTKTRSLRTSVPTRSPVSNLMHSLWKIAPAASLSFAWNCIGRGVNGLPVTVAADVKVQTVLRVCKPPAESPCGRMASLRITKCLLSIAGQGRSSNSAAINRAKASKRSLGFRRTSRQTNRLPRPRHLLALLFRSCTICSRWRRRKRNTIRAAIRFDGIGRHAEGR